MDFLHTLRYLGPCGTNGKSYQIDYNKFVKARKDKTIVGYENNRKIDINRVLEMSNNFSPNNFTRIIAVEEKVNGKSVIKQMSCHHRSLAIEALANRNGGLGSIGNCVLTIEIYPKAEALSLYVIEGDSVSLKTYDLLTNVDYAYSHVLADSIRHVDLSDYKGVTIMKDTLFNNLANMIYVMNTANYNDLTFAQVINNKISAEVKKLVRIPHKDPSFTIKMTKERLTQLTQGLNYAITVMKTIIDNCDESNGANKNAKLNERGRELTKQGRLVSYLVWTKIVGGAVTQIQPETLARALCEKDGQLITDAINALNNRDWQTFSSKIYDLARTKKGWAKGN